MRTLVERARRRVAGSAPGQSAARAVSRARLRTFHTDDESLAGLLAALRSPSDGEERWSAEIEAQRGQLESSPDVVSLPVTDREWWERAIATSSDPRPPVLHGDRLDRNVGEITRVTSKPPDWGRLLYRIARRLRPGRCLELGTSVGISGSYIGAGLEANGSGRLITIEGQPAVAAIARTSFEQVGVSGRVEGRVGSFADELPGALAALGGVDLAFIDGHHQYEPTLDYFAAIRDATGGRALFVFDDITYTRGDMAAAWRDIRAHPRVTGSLTVGSVGFAVIDGRRWGHRSLPELAL
jgi:predicted O-methyltransferase YrrM